MKNQNDLRRKAPDMEIQSSCPCCKESTRYIDNLKKMIQYREQGVPETEWEIPYKTSISMYPYTKTGIKVGGIQNTEICKWRKGSKILSKLGIGRVYYLQTEAFICHTCGMTWTSEPHEVDA